MELLRENIARNKSALKGSVVAFDLNWESDTLGDLGGFDLIIASECIVPRLYPLEPFVRCLAKLCHPKTMAFVAYEHRPFHLYDPRDRFKSLLAQDGICVTSVPVEDQDPNFTAEDIIIWQLQR